MRRPLRFVIPALLFSAFIVATSASAAVPGLSRLALGTSASVGTASLPSYSYVLLSPSESGYIAGIKAGSPATKVLSYFSAMEAMDYCACPISYQQALAHDASSPGDPWLLYSASGQSLTMPSYPSNHLVNVGSASYQQAWTAAVAASLRAGGFDGLYLDSVLGRISDTGTSPTLYSSDAAWETAMRSFVAYVGPALKSQGFYVLANSYKSGPNDGTDDIAWWASLAPYVSGLQSEYWEQAADAVTPFDTNPCCWTGHWLNWLKLADAAQQNGADFFTVDKGTASNTQLMGYLRGSYLLVWNGQGGGFSYAHEPDDGVDAWNPAWTTSLGTPTGARYQVGVSWRRDYSGGTVVVNPDPSSAQTVDLGGSYQTIAGATVSSITLQPHTAALLTGPLGGAPPPSGTYNTLKARHSGQCLDVYGVSLVNGARVAQWTCNGGDNQRWQLQAVGGGYYNLVVKHSGQCLDVYGASQADGASVVQWPCNGGSNQQWQLVATDSGYAKLIARHSGKCLDVYGVSQVPGATVVQWTCNGGTNQQWLTAAG